MGADVQRAAFLTLLALLLALTACSGGDDEQSYGGADALPGPLPSGVEFTEPSAGGVPAPDFTAELLDGSELTASDLWDDRPVVVVFTASWCEACKEQHAQVAETVAEHEGMAVLAVVPGDDAAGAREYAAELEVDHPVAVAGDRIWLDWAAREPPLVVLVGPGGTVLRGWPGGVEPGVLADELDALAGAPADR
jgi:thiol-disulfide isomerase/thioredoxin